MSRSDTMPSIVEPSALATSAPNPFSRSSAVASARVAVGAIVTTSDPFVDKMDWTFM